MAAASRGSSPAESDAPEVYFRSSFHTTVFDAMRSREGWLETDSDTDWDFNWASVDWIREFSDTIKLEDHQRVNHFRNHYELTRKDLLVKNVKRMRKQLERMEDHEEAAAYNFVPESFVLPGDYALFVEAFKRASGTWIMKPVGGAQGRGIFLITKLSQIAQWRKDHTWKSDGPRVDSYIVQRYVDRPYTVGSKKFDCRLYALVTSYTPLTVWFHRSGFARFSSARYDRAAGTDALHMHLTNVAIQKSTAAYAASGGSKLGIRELKLFMASKHGLPVVNRLMGDIEALVVRSLLACQPVIIQDRHCFELYGYDILWDETLKPWLLEVNASPSLSADTDSDYRMKRALLSDMLDVIDLEGKRTGEEITVGGFDLIWDGGPVEHKRPGGMSSFLGTHSVTTTKFAGATRLFGKESSLALAEGTMAQEEVQRRLADPSNTAGYGTTAGKPARLPRAPATGAAAGEEAAASTADASRHPSVPASARAPSPIVVGASRGAAGFAAAAASGAGEARGGTTASPMVAGGDRGLREGQGTGGSARLLGLQ